MTNYKLEWRFLSDLPKELIEETLETVAVEYGFKVRKQLVTETRPRGRQSAATKKIKFFLERRTKPFSAKTFGDFVGLSGSAAWRRLDRLVAAQQLHKITNDDGSVMYSTQMLEPY